MKLVFIMNCILASIVAKADYISFNCDPSFTKKKIKEFYNEGSYEKTPKTISFSDLSGEYYFNYNGIEVNRDDFSVSTDNNYHYTVTLNSTIDQLSPGLEFVFNAKDSNNEYSALLTIFDATTYSDKIQLGKALNCLY